MIIKIGDRIREFRQQRGLTVEDLSQRITASRFSRDIEDYDELEINLELVGVIELCDLFEVTPWVLLGVDFPIIQILTARECVDRVKAELRKYSISPEAFSEDCGWDINAVLQNPDYFLEWPLGALRDICMKADISWMAVLNGIYRARSKSPRD